MTSGKFSITIAPKVSVRYSILTPTLCRPTLKRLCDSIDKQSTRSWEHIIMVDVPENELTVADQELLKSVKHPQRRIYFCDRRHKNFGNTCRRTAFQYATGEYMCQIDDDDFYADNDALKTLECVTETWAIYPVLARGKRCHRNPPGIGQTGSAMFIYRRDTGIKFSDNDHYAADGEVVEELKKSYKYQSLDRERELVIYPWANHGMEQKDIDTRVLKQKRRGAVKYAKDGLTVDWFDQFELP
jgi:glycosyltransferase involved in cell wall biosynthesis